jgi:hypothetical protein
VSILGKLDQWAGRFNRWFGGAAVAAGAEHTGASGGPPVVDPAAVAAVMGEIERESENSKRD